MSKTVDERVVEMRFDNKQFESNVQTSLSTLDKLKKSLDLSGASKGLESVGNAAKNVNMSGLGGAVETVRAKFSALEVIAVTALANITNSVINTGKQMLNSLTIAPITQGLGEYELKMGSVQTIMASTGESLQTVNQYLQELNTYADKTIYSFSDMTNNIGKFTNAGVKLEDAVAAIKGVSNEAAISGANANEASRAMYNFAQALSAGYVKLIDWKSIENANMATVGFKEQLIETAVAMGTVIKVGDKYQSVTTDLNGNVSELFDSTSMFNDSLSAQWMTTDVLVQTLGNYATDIREMTKDEVAAYEAKLKSIGYTQEQIEEIERLGQKAADAAQEVKTFHQLMDTLAEAAGSGWAETWEIIFGDFEEAKALWTSVSDVVGGFIDRMSDARNEFLKGGLSSGWKQFTDIVSETGISVEDFQKRVVELGKSKGLLNDEMIDLIENEGKFQETLKSGWLTADLLKEAVHSYTGTMSTASESTSAMSKELMSLDDVARAVWRGEFFNGEERKKALKEAGYDYDIVMTAVDALENNWSMKLSELSDEQLMNIGYTKEQVQQIHELGAALEGGTMNFSAMSDEQLKSQGYTEEQIQKIRELQEALDNGTISAEEFAEAMARDSGRENLIAAAANAFKGLLSVLTPIKEAFRDIFPPTTSDQLYQMTVAIREFSEKLTLSDKASANLKSTFRGLFAVLDIVRQAFSAVWNVVKNLIGPAKSLSGGVLELTGSFGEWLVRLSEFIRENNVFGNALQTAIGLISKLASVAKGFVNGILAKFKLPSLDSFIYKLKIVRDALKFDLRFNNLTDFSHTLATIKEQFPGLYSAAEKAKKAFDDLGKKVKSGLSSVKDWFVSLTEGADGAKLSLSDIGTAISDRLAKVWTSVKDFAKKIADAFKNLFKSKDDSTDFASEMEEKLAPFMQSAKGGFSSFLDNISEAWSKFWNKLKEIGGGVGKILGDLFESLTGEHFKGILNLAKSGSLIKLATGLKTFLQSFKGFDGIASTFSKFLGEAGSTLKSFRKENKAKQILEIAAALGILAIAIIALGSVAPYTLIQGLTGLAGALLVLGLACKYIESSVKQGAGILMMAGALALLIPSILAFGHMKVETIAKGLVTIGIALAEFAGATKLMNGSKGGAGTIAALAAALLTLVPAITILGLLPLETLAKGLGTITIALFAFAGATRLMGNLKGSTGPILAFAAALLVLAPAMALLGLLSWESIAKGLITIGVSLGAFALVAKSLEKTTGSLTKFGVAIIAFAGGLAILALVISSFEGIEWNTLGKAGAAIAALVAVAAILDHVSVNILEALSTLVSLAGFCGVLYILGLAMEPFKSMTWADLGQAGAAIAGLLVVALACSGLSTVIGPAIVGAAGLLVIAGLLGAAVLAFSKLIELATDSLPMMGTNLSQFMTNLQPFMDGVKQFDEATASCIGSFVGAMLKLTGAELLQGLTSWLTGGDALSSFASELAEAGPNIKIFADSINDVSWEAIGSFADTVKKLTGAELLQGLTSWITGGNALSDFASELAAAGPNIKSFADSMAGTDSSQLSDAAASIAALASAADGIPNEGGLVAKITGDNSISAFAQELAIAGPFVSLFAACMAGVDTDKVSSAAAAIAALASAANDIPNEGGFVAKITGDNSISAFAEELATAGPFIATFSANMANVNTDKIISAGAAIAAMASAADGIPNTGGWLSKVTGDNSISSFASELAGAGPNIKIFADAMNGITVEQVETASSVIDSLIAMVEKLAGSDAASTEGIFEKIGNWFSGDNSISSFTTTLSELGTSIAEFGTCLNSFDTTKLDSINTSLEDFQTAISEISTEAIDDFIEGFTNADSRIVSAAQGMLDKFITTVNGKEPEVDTAFKNLMDSALSEIESRQLDYQTKAQLLVAKMISGVSTSETAFKQSFVLIIGVALDAINAKQSDFNTAGGNLVSSLGSGISGSKAASNAAGSVASNAASAARGYYGTFSSAGDYLVQGFAAGISSATWRAEAKARAMASAAAAAARKTLAIRSPSKVGYEIGDYFGIGFANALSDSASRSYQASSDMAMSAKDGLLKAIAAVSAVSFDTLEIEPTVRPVLDLANIQNGARTLYSMVGGMTSALPIGSLNMASQVQQSLNSRSVAVDDAVPVAINGLEKAIKDLIANPPVHNENNFSITSDDPEEIARYVSRQIWKEVSRRSSQWE